ncbi:NnrS family protein [Halomonas campisalis]|uniref:NnrS family protein n=1 Tax=Billgrantia campisalis TaxID=74661 RepID=A0ABS9PBG9_9GAMM|nr:NnrS family protein [Halomonas campisalis]MCG6659123.1 NnrS family protein [Halomonas campisalis]MDR5863842.1 NnrS family protein [Halomonas campisalis]
MTPPLDSSAPPRLPVLAYAFRPFFLLAALYAPLALLPWVGGMLQLFSLDLGMPPMAWHAHEMLFGFVAAALAGFLLTAVPSWARVEPLTGAPLAALVLLWLAGRSAFWLAGTLPGWLVALVNLAFPLVVLGWALPALLSPEGRRHLSLGVLLGGVLLAQLGFYLAWLAPLSLPFGLLDPLHLAANLLLIMIAVTATRIVRVVAMAAVQASGAERPLRFTSAREHLAVATLCLFALADFLAQGHPVTGWIALAAAAAQADRLSEWPWGRAMGRLYLLLLTLAYAWLTLGLVLVGVTALVESLPAYAGRHALFLGAIGTAVLAVFCIAGLRHTGRSLELPRSIWLALACLLLGTALRTGVPLLWPQQYLVVSVVAAAALWLLAFLGYAFGYARMLLSARPDGLPG